MRVLAGPTIETSQTKNDHCRTTPGEILFFWDCPCDCSNCGRHTFTGTESYKSSLYAEIVERPDLDPAVLREIFLKTMTLAGWIEAPFDDEVLDWANQAVSDIQMSDLLELGAIVKRTPDGVHVEVPGVAGSEVKRFRSPARTTKTPRRKAKGR